MVQHPAREETLEDAYFDAYPVPLLLQQKWQLALEFEGPDWSDHFLCQ